MHPVVAGHGLPVDGEDSTGHFAGQPKKGSKIYTNIVKRIDNSVNKSVVGKLFRLKGSGHVSTHGLNETLATQRRSLT
jgi:hypothetical protein